MQITVAADGSALGNPGPAGWAWFVDEKNWACGGQKNSTNNRGELMAVIDFLEATSGFLDLEIRFLCDSQYVINSVTKWMPGWKRRNWRKADGKPVLNDDLMKRLDVLLKNRNVRFDWVKGHAGHDLNEKADNLARAAATAYRAGEKPQSGPGLANFLSGLSHSDPPSSTPSRKAFEDSSALNNPNRKTSPSQNPKSAIQPTLF